MYYNASVGPFADDRGPFVDAIERERRERESRQNLNQEAAMHLREPVKAITCSLDICVPWY